jgi:hypothetical protein
MEVKMDQNQNEQTDPMVSWVVELKWDAAVLAAAEVTEEDTRNLVIRAITMINQNTAESYGREMVQVFQNTKEPNFLKFTSPKSWVSDVQATVDSLLMQISDLIVFKAFGLSFPVLLPES